MLMRVEAVGVCASDLKCYHGAAKFWGDENRQAWAQTGVTPGHEFVGTNLQADEEATSYHYVEVGDRVACGQIVPCWECRYCLMGAYWMCAPHDMFGFRNYNGAMAEYLIIPKKALPHKDSKELPAHHAAFSEQLSCSMHAVERAGIQFNDDVVVVAGAGPIGLGAIAGARRKNPLKIVALDMVEEKLELAKKCGADEVINIGNEDAVEKIKEMTGGYGADVYIEATGARGGPGHQPAPQTRHVRRVLGVQGQRHGRLVDHLRQQGAERPRRAPRAAVLAGCDQAARGGRAAARGDLHPPVPPREVPGGARSGRRLLRWIRHGRHHPRVLKHAASTHSAIR
jgi:threonine dehydrogenase-like Zn-dependent dehydrogenase